MTITTIEFERGLATLIAALIASISSILTLIYNKRNEVRTTRRKILETFIIELPDSIHQLIAISTILLKNKTPESRANWSEKAEFAKNKLKELWPKLRYGLWGIDHSLLSLTRLPDHTLYTHLDIDVTAQVVRRGTRLGDAIDICIRSCYLNGRYIRIYEILRIGLYEWH